MPKISHLFARNEDVKMSQEKLLTSAEEYALTEHILNRF